MKTKSIYRAAVFIIVLSVFSGTVPAQTEQQLTATITRLDSAFWKAYNNCDTTQFIKYLTDDVEFYHDKGGITTGATALIKSLDKNLCSNSNYHLRREAVAGTVKVYPMQNRNEIYGAIISGEHVFYITENGKPEYLDGDANFTQLWLLKNGTWKMARILSFNHHAAEYKNNRKEAEVPVQQLEQLTGTYKSEKFGIMAVTRENKVLLLKSDNNSFTLYPLRDTLFFTKERDLTFQFVKDAAGKPVKMIVNEHGVKADELMFEK
jgi:Domain of unknown function (DUF4440)/Domain of unknown function (DUF3471)